MKLWDKVMELMECVEDGEGFYGKLISPIHQEFIESLHENLDPHNAYDELSYRQVEYVEKLWEIYCNGGSFEEF